MVSGRKKERKERRREERKEGRKKEAKRGSRGDRVVSSILVGAKIGIVKDAR